MPNFNRFATRNTCVSTAIAGVPNNTDTTTFAVFDLHRVIQRADQIHVALLHDIVLPIYDKWQSNSCLRFIQTTILDKSF